MKILKSYSGKHIVRGAILLLGLFLLTFYIYPPFLLFVRSYENWNEIFGKWPSLLRPLLNSIRIAASVWLTTSVIGGSLAVLRVKTDFPVKKLIDRLSVVSFAIPPYILALAWLQLFGRNGYIGRFLGLFLNFQTDMQPYSVTAVVIVMSIHLYPLMYMSIRNALSDASVELEKAALLSGAGPMKSLFSVTLPLVTPAFMSTGLLVFSRTLANFAVPALLCLPVGIEVVPTGIYSALSGLRISDAAVLSLLLVLISTGLHVIQCFLFSKRQKSVPSALKGGRVYNLSFFKWPVAVLVSVFFISVCIIPLGAMIISSFQLRWGLPLCREYFTLNNYIELFSCHGSTLKAFRNSLVYGLTASAMACVVGCGASLAAYNMKSRFGKILEAAASWPMAIPNTVLAVAAIFAWNRPPLRFYGTPWAIIITYMVLFTPIIMKQISGLLASHDRSLVLAARTMGASGFKSFFKITLPLIVPGIRAGIILCLMIALREIPISLMLYSSGQETVGILLFGMQSQSYGLEMTSALAVVVIILILTGDKLIGNRKGKNNE